MTTKRLTDIARSHDIPLIPEKLEAFKDRDVVLTGFSFNEGQKGPYAMLEIADGDGVKHFVSCGGVGILRVLHGIDPSADLPAVVKFVKMRTGSGNLAWGIE